MQRLHGAWKAARPGLQISMSPSPFPWGYEAELRKISHDQVCPAQLGRVFPGLLLSLGREYRASPELLRGMVAANRHAGVLGEVFFHSEGLEQLPLRP